MRQDASKARVAVVSDLSAGGAAISCRRLCDGLTALGRPPVRVVSKIVVDGARYRASDWPDLPAYVLYRLAASLRLRGCWADGAERRLNETDVLARLRRADPQIINLHNIHQAMTFRLAERLPASMPLVWTLHDMWPLTGGCFYSRGCSEHLEGCLGPCPEEHEGGGACAARGQEWRRRRRFFEREKERIVLVCPSRWLAGIATRSFAGRVRVECIPYGLDLDVFRPRGNTRELRSVLGLPLNGKVLLFGADALDDRRKGAAHLKEAIALVSSAVGGSLSVVTFGGRHDKVKAPADWRARGRLHDEELLSMYYAAADVFVLPSLADNLPNTLLEAIASGTPCVSFDVGGCAEIVRNGETGATAEAGSSPSLARAIESVLRLRDDEARRMRERCRAVAENEYALSIQATRYAKLFDDLKNCGGSAGPHALAPARNTAAKR